MARGVYAVTLGRGGLATNVYLVRCGSSWTLIDVGWLGSEKHIQDAAEAVFGRAPRPASMILTHLHPDHSGAARRLAEHWGSGRTGTRPSCRWPRDTDRSTRFLSTAAKHRPDDRSARR